MRSRPWISPSPPQSLQFSLFPAEGEELPPAEHPKAGRKAGFILGLLLRSDGQENPLERLNEVPTTETPGSSSQEHERPPQPQHPLGFGSENQGGKGPSQ